MYASAWMRVDEPIVVSFSTSEPRPTTTSSPIVTRSRTHDWSPRITRAPMVEPANTIAPVETIVPSPIRAGSSGSRFAVERGDSDGCLPTTAFSSTFTPSPSTVPGWTIADGWTSAATERLREHLQRAHHAGAVARDLRPVAVALDELEEAGALEPQRLGGRDLRDVDVARPRLPLAVRLGALPGRLLVHRHLPLELHVVEDRHLLAAHDGELPHLVRVEPRQVHVRDLAAREAQEAEHHVLHARREEVAPLRGRDLGVLVEQVEDHAQVVHAERPERVLVRADDPEVLAVAVDAQHLAQFAAVDELLQLLHARVVEEEVARHQHEVPRRRELDELGHLGRAHRGRLLDQHVLARLERLLRERVVRRHRRRDHDRVDAVVGEHLGEVVGRARLRVARGEALAQLRVEVAEPGQLGELVEVADEVRAPVPEPRHGDPSQSFQTLPSTSTPFVAFRKSTITLPRRTTSP